MTTSDTDTQVADHQLELALREIGGARDQMARGLRYLQEINSRYKDSTLREQQARLFGLFVQTDALLADIEKTTSGD